MERGLFSDVAIVSCGTLSLELNYLRTTGFLDAAQLLYTAAGLHQDCRELERQLVQRIAKAKQTVDKVIVVYGGKFCYVNVQEPTRVMEKVVAEQGPGVVRIEASHCVDMLVDAAERELIANGETIWWMTPGWIEFRHRVFAGWDKGLANENFPRHTGGAIVLDALGYFDKYVQERPEDLLEYSDWMGIPIQAHPISLERLKSLLMEQANRLRE